MTEKRTARSAFNGDGMFNNAHPLLFALATELRKNMTHAEMILWGHLKADFGGLKFRRQHPLSLYIVDFYCHKLKLIIEIDGSVHEDEEVRKNDIKRENDLKEMGYIVIRFTNERVERETGKVLAEIRDIIENLKTT